MLPTEILRQVRRIEIKTRRLVDENLAGKYHTAFKGQGMEFSEVRAYQPGDDIRAIDWNVTARSGEPFIKKFIEERELTVMIMVDMSGSLEYGSLEKTKRNLAAELTALFAFSAIRNQDKVGCLIFTDQIELFVPPKKGRKHVLRLVREILAFQPQGVATDVAEALRYFSKVVKRKAVVLLISDFMAPDFQKPLSHLASRHDLIAISLRDAREIEPPKGGLFALEDGETGQERIIDFGSRRVREAYRERAETRFETLSQLLRRSKVDHIPVRTDVPYDKALTQFFEMRELRR